MQECDGEANFFDLNKAAAPLPLKAFSEFWWGQHVTAGHFRPPHAARPSMISHKQKCVLVGCGGRRCAGQAWFQMVLGLVQTVRAHHSKR